MSIVGCGPSLGVQKRVSRPCVIPADGLWTALPSGLREINSLSARLYMQQYTYMHATEKERLPAVNLA